MPGKRKRSRKYERKTTVYRRKKKRRKSRRIPRGLFAKTTKMAFRYVDTITINPGLSAMSYYTYSANGMYDPDITGTGHQPRGFDQYMQFYQHYTVIGSKMKCTFIQADTINGFSNQAYVAIHQTAQPTPALTAINDILEVKGAKGLAQVMGVRPQKLTSACSLSKVFGQKVLQEDNNAGQSGSNPSEQWYYQIMAGSTNEGSHDPLAMRVMVQIDYIAVLHEPRQIAGS